MNSTTTSDSALEVIRNIADGLVNVDTVHIEVSQALHEAANTLEVSNEVVENSTHTSGKMVGQEVSELSERCCPLCKGRGYTDGS